MRFSIVAIMLLAVILITNGVVYGQEPTADPTPTPTPTPTPAWQEAVMLSSGNELLIERRITYGDIALVCAVGGVGVIVLCYMAIRVPKLWI